MCKKTYSSHVYARKDLKMDFLFKTALEED